MKRSLVIITGVMVVVFGPNLMGLSTHAIGEQGTDSLKHIWSQWLVHHQLLSGEGLRLHTPLLHFPTGGAFFSLDTLNALIGLPLRGIFSSSTTYNLVLIATITAAAVTGAMLTRSLTSKAYAPALGGIGFALSAWVLCFPLASGVTETAVFWPLPLIMLFATRSWTRPGYLAPALTGGLLAIQGLGCWSHGITAGLLILGLTTAALMADRKALTDIDRLKRIATIAVFAGLAALPLYLAVAGTVSADDAIKTRTLSLFHSAPIGPLAVPEANAMALADFVLPGWMGRRVNAMGTERLMYAAYPGFVLFVLGFVAIKRRAKHARLLAIGVLVMALLSMGPRIYLDHARAIGGLPNPVYLLAYWLVPLVNTTIHSVDRFAVGVQLCLALLAALGLAELPKRFRPWWIAAFVLELLWVSPGPWPIPSVQVTAHPASLYIAQSQDTGAVIDLPFIKSNPHAQWFDGDIFMQQTVHGRPIPFQLEGHGLETVSPPIRENPFFRGLANALIFGHPPTTQCTGAKDLATMGVSWLVWRPQSPPNAKEHAIAKTLAACLGEPTQHGDRWVFALN